MIVFVGSGHNPHWGDVYEFLYGEYRWWLILNDYKRVRVYVPGVSTRKLHELYNSKQLKQPSVAMFAEAIPQEVWLKDVLLGHQIAVYLRDKKILKYN